MMRIVTSQYREVTGEAMAQKQQGVPKLDSRLKFTGRKQLEVYCSQED